jgi:hypothetical protein
LGGWLGSINEDSMPNSRSARLQPLHRVCRRGNAARLLCAIAALLSGCLGRGDPGEGVAVVQQRLERECTTPPDEDLILAILTQTLSDEQLEELHCTESEECPCGTYCDDGFCTADCLSTDHPDYGCSGGEECDLWGRCDTPGAPPDPQRVVIDVTPPSVEVIAVPSGEPYEPIEITVIATAQELPDDPPSVRVRGNHTTRVECPGGGQSCEDPNQQVVRELEVQCEEGGPFTAECDLDSWQFSGSGTSFEATRSVQVRPRADAQETAWQLFFDGDDVVSSQTVSLVRQSATPQPFDGTYQGRMVISRRGPPGLPDAPDAGPSLAAEPTNLAVRVTALVEDDHVLLVDPSRMVTPSGKIRLGPTGTSSQLEWLSSDGGSLIGTLASQLREHDSATGHLELRFALTLPLHDEDEAHTLDVLVELDRRSAVGAPTCTTAGTCVASGHSCDQVLQRCLPGPAFAVSSAPPGNGLASTSLWSWTNAIVPYLSMWGLSVDGFVGDEAIERLQCYDGLASSYESVLGKTIMSLTGDVRCAQPSEPFPFGLRLLNAVDINGGVSASQNVATLLGQCLTDLLAQPPATPSSTFSPAATSCVSLARVLPGIGIALQHSDFRDAGGRTAALLQHLVRGWVTIGAFAAQQGLEAVELGEADPAAPQTDLATLLDNMDKVWGLVTDGNLAQALTTLRPQQLALPDYRGRNRPRAYWPGYGSTDVAGGRTLGPAPWWPSADAVEINPKQLDLTDDLTVAMELDLDLAEAYRSQRLLVDSPWFSADIVMSNHTYYEQNYKRGNPNGTLKPQANDWQMCHQYCVWDQPFGCQSWSFNTNAPSGQRCFLHTGYADHVYAPGWKSNVISILPRPFVDNRSYVYIMSQQGFMLPTTIENTSQSSWPACYERCFNNDNCVSFTWRSDTGNCGLHSGSRGPSPAICTTCTSAYMPRFTLNMSHLTTTRVRATSSMQLKRSMLRNGPIRMAFVRTLDDQKYRVYANGALIGSTTFTDPPTRWLPAPFQVGRRDNWPNEASDGYAIGFEKVGHVAVWDGALDRGELLSMQSRTGNWAWRGPVTIPTGTQARNHEQKRSLAVTLLETLNKQVQLLEAYLKSKQGAVYGECIAGQSTALREQVQSKVSKTLRSAVYVEDLAARMHDRARQIECDRNTDCPAQSQCGDKPRKLLTALGGGVTMTGLMQHCLAWYVTDIEQTGLCVPIVPYGDPNANGGLGGNGSSVPGAVGTATFTFQIDEPGTYALWGKVLAGQYQTGFWIRIDGGPWIQWDTLGGWYLWSKVPGTVEFSAGTHSIVLGVRDDGTSLHELYVTKELDRAPDDLGDVCVAADGPVLAPIAGTEDERNEATFRGALAGLDAAMQRVAVSSAGLGDCRNPLGIEEVDLPLYFMDVQGGPVQRHFGASIYLHGLAAGAVDAGRGALEDVRNAWNQKRLERFQTETTGLDNQRRVESIASQYSDGLEDLCGASSAAPGGILMEFKDGRDPATCFVRSENPACLPNFDEPISQADHTCYQGSVGQALIGMKQAHFAIEGARIQWDSKQREYDAKAAACAHLQDTAEIIDAHIKHMEALRKKKALFDKISGIVSLAAGVPSGYAGLLAAKDIFSGGKPSIGEAKGAAEFLGAASGAISMLGGLTSGAEMAEETAKFEAQMTQRDNELAIMECFAAADKLRDEINLTANSIIQAVSEFEQAAVTFANRRLRIEQLVSEGLADIAREGDRSLALPYHHYWLDERIERYHRKMAWAQRLVYLFMRAVEYDAQQSLPYRDEVLGARNPNELEAVLEDIFQVLAEYEVGPRGGDPQSRVLEVTAREIMGIATNDADSFGQYLLSPDSYVYTSGGELIGRGVRFQITPTSEFLQGNQIVDDCAEKFTTFTGSVQITNGSSLTRVPFVLMQANTFASQECVSSNYVGDVPILLASHRPSENLFDETGEGVSDLGEVARRTIATVSNFPNLRPQDLAGGDTQAVNTSFAGRGVYGDYVLVIRENVAQQLNLADVTDVLVRLDYTGVENGLTTD